MRSSAALTLYSAVVVALSCAPTEPKATTTAAGEWSGIMVNSHDVWTMDLETTQTGDSIHGQADVQGSRGFADGYFVQGARDGDSITLRMQPAEDATVFFEGTMVGQDEIVGRAWFNNFRDDDRPVVFTRMPNTPVSLEVGRKPLTELGIDTYKGFPGGLYTGSNEPPAAHAADGIARRNAIVPLGTNGTPSANGRIVLISVGMSNTTQEFCSGSSTTTQCLSFTFMGQAAADAQVNHTTLAIVNGARSSMVADQWDQPTDQQYDTVRFNRLAVLGFTEQQVQIAWVKLAIPTPNDPLPAPSDANNLAEALGRVMRALKVRYPNLRMVFLSSRIYGGWATTNLNPEPYAFEGGYAAKWLIAAQIRQIAGAPPDPTMGDLDYRTGVAPWVAWGPYLWADGLTPRQADGLVWTQADMQSDGTHPSNSGMQKVGTQLMTFFKTSPFTSCWFLSGQVCQ